MPQPSVTRSQESGTGCDLGSGEMAYAVHSVNSSNTSQSWEEPMHAEEGGYHIPFKCEQQFELIVGFMCSCISKKTR